jgi:hypothetical protein
MGLNPVAAWWLWWSTALLGASKVCMDIAEQVESDDD